MCPPPRVRVVCRGGVRLASVSSLFDEEDAILDPQALAPEAPLQHALHALGALDQRLDLRQLLAGQDPSALGVRSVS